MIMKKFLNLFVMLLVISFMLSVPALAGGPPSWYVQVSSGQFAPWGQELVSSAVVAVDNNFPDNNQAFAPPAGTNSWTSIQIGSDSFGYLSRMTPPARIDGEIWSGSNEDRQYYQTTFGLYGAEWGKRALTLKNSAGFPVIMSEPFTNGISKTFWLSSSERYTYSLTSVVPEPGTIVSLLGGLIGLAGFGLRRRL